MKNRIYLIIFLCLTTTVFSQSQKVGLQLVIVDQNNDQVQDAEIQVKLPAGEILIEQRITGGEGRIWLPENTSVTLEIRAEGFKPLVREIVVTEDSKKIRATLQIGQIEEEVSIQMSRREKRFSDSISKILTQEEIDKLPENPEDIKRTLQDKYGGDVIFKVDGFTGGQFPTKSQIASISISMTPFDTEYREGGEVVIDIRTKVTPSKSWAGFGSYAISDSILDARNAFANFKAPENFQGFRIYVDPPSLNQNTSVQFSLAGERRKGYQYFVLDDAQSNVDSRVKISSEIQPEITFKRNLPNSWSLISRYGYRRVNTKNAGLSPLDISERSFNSNSDSHDLRLTLNGNLPKEVMNQFRVRYINSHSSVDSNSDAPTIVVPGEFISGGAGLGSRVSTRNIEIAEVITFLYKNHLIKAGGSTRLLSKNFRIENNINGRYTFSGLADFNAGVPLLYEIREGVSSFSYSNTEISGFVQDYFLVKKFLQIGLGIRWDYDSVFNDKNNFAPRASVVWSPEKSGRFIVKGGIGSFYYSTGSDPFTEVYSNSESQPQAIRVLFPDYPIPNIFDSDSGETQTISRLGQTRNPISNNAILGAKFEYSKFLNLTAGVAVSRANYLPRIRDANAPIDGIRPNPQYGIIKLTEFAGNLTNVASQISADIKLRRLSFQIEYTNSYNAIDYIPDELPTNNENLKLDKGTTDDNRTHSISIVSDFKLSRILPYKPLSNIYVYAFSSIQSGKPYNVTTGFDDNGDGVINDRPLGIPHNSNRENWKFQTNLTLYWTPNLFKKQIGGKSLSIAATINNLFNHANLTNFIGVMSSSNFMRPTAAYPARNMRLRVSFSF